MLGMHGVDAAAKKKKQDQTNFFEIHLTLLHIFYVLFHSDTWMGLGGTRTASIQTLYSHLYFVFIQILLSIYSIIILYYFGVFQFFIDILET